MLLCASCSDGSIYIGPWVTDTRHGKGLKFSADGEVSGAAIPNGAIDGLMHVASSGTVHLGRVG